MNELMMKIVENTLSSLEVSEMVGKEHKNVMRDIRNYVSELSELKIEPGNFFIFLIGKTSAKFHWLSNRE